MELLTRAADARARLLRVERSEEPAEGADGTEIVALTFDAGRIILSAVPGQTGLELTTTEDASPAPAGLLAADEEEPWWRLLGNPITAVWPGSSGAGAVTAEGGEAGSLTEIRMQFRETDDHPRLVSVARLGDLIIATLEKIDD